jgi:hypothetical protein
MTRMDTNLCKPITLQINQIEQIEANADLNHEWTRIGTND